jgi:aminopeptidase
MLKRYAQLLTQYCLEVKPGDKVFISTSMLAEPLLREVYRCMLEAGAAVVDCDLGFRERERLLMEFGSEAAISTPPTLHSMAMEQYDCYLNIRAPYNLKESKGGTPEKSKLRQAAAAPAQQAYFRRIADGSMRRSLCQYPTQASAQEAEMSLSEYEDFVFNACRLNEPDPIAAWLEVRKMQQSKVDYLNKCKTVRYVNGETDIRFSTDGRTWINSDGRSNMPSGEVFTSPVEDSVNGTIYFSYPGIYQGREVENVRLYVKDGVVEKWEATRGKDFLDYIFSIPGARQFGEAAIGTNYRINRMTKNILFDEKIGGTIHMAIGQSYLQAGGKNESSIHWDMITDMTNGGQIFADDTLIYENGNFIIP